MDLIAIAMGFGVGAAVGVTGVGGGSLMTPLLLSAFRLPPVVAIGTDLWFAAITKSVGSASYHTAGHVQWRLVSSLLAGSIPASLATIAAMHATGVTRGWADALTISLGIALILTAVAAAYRRAWMRLGLRLERWLGAPYRTPVTVLCGVALGVLVSLCSIGAGAIGGMLILLLHPRLDAQQVVGTDIAHAVPLTLVAGIGHATLGHVDWTLLVWLLAGSIPGIWAGARLAGLMPERVVRVLLCGSLVTAGVKVMA